MSCCRTRHGPADCSLALLSPPYRWLLAGLTAIAIAALSRNLLATIGGGLLVFFLLHWAFGQLPV